MKKKNKVKKIVAIYLVVVFVLSAIAVVSVSAKTYTKTHTVEVASIPGDYDYEPAYMGGSGRMSDTFQANPTIFNNYTSSENRVRAINVDENKYYPWVEFTLYQNSGAPKTVIYGTNVDSGEYQVRYENVSKGGFRASSILSTTY